MFVKVKLLNSNVFVNGKINQFIVIILNQIKNTERIE